MLNKEESDEQESCRSETETFNPAQELTFFGTNFLLTKTLDIEFSGSSKMRIEDLLINYQVHLGLFDILVNHVIRNFIFFQKYEIW